MCYQMNQDGKCVYDKLVKPTQDVTDYMTRYSGICKEDLEKGEEFLKVRLEVFGILRDKIVVGHSIERNFELLNLKHLKHKPELIRNTAAYSPCTECNKIIYTVSQKKRLKINIFEIFNLQRFSDTVAVTLVVDFFKKIFKIDMTLF